MFYHILVFSLLHTSTSDFAIYCDKQTIMVTAVKKNIALDIMSISGKQTHAVQS